MISLEDIFNDNEIAVQEVVEIIHEPYRDVIKYADGTIEIYQIGE